MTESESAPESGETDTHRICMVLPDPFPRDVRVEKEIRALREAGHEVVVVCRGSGDGDGDELTREHVDVADGIPVVRVQRDGPRARVANVASAAVDTAVGVHPRWLLAVDRVADDFDASALHVHDLPLLRTGLVVGHRRDLPVVADLHENYPEAVRQWRREGPGVRKNPLAAAKRAFLPVSRLKRRERRVVPEADRVVTVVEEAREHYCRDCGVPPLRTQVVGNTVDQEVFDPETVEPASVDGLDDDRFTAAYVGGFGPHRGLETAIRALAATGDGVELLLVGDGPKMADLRDLATDLGVASRVTFTGWVNLDDVPRYVAAADAGLVPHAATPHTETTIPHKLFQYMSMGRPVVVSALAPLERVVDGADAGRVVPPGDASSLAGVLAEFAENRALATRFGRNGRAAVEETYHWGRDAERLREVYRDL